MLLNIFNDLVVIYNENIKNSFLNAVSFDIIFVFLIVIFSLIIFLLILVFIFPLFKPSSAKLFKKYEYYLREMRRIDELYSQKKLIFDEYVSQQFTNAQQYARIVKILSADPNYKEKLQSYTLQKNHENYPTTPRKLTAEEIHSKQVNKLCEVLKPKASSFSKEDIYSVLLYEGFEDDLIMDVLSELVRKNVVFSKRSSSDKKDLSLFLDDLIKGKESANLKGISTSESINFKDTKKSDLFTEDFKRKELNFDKIDDVDYTFKPEVVPTSSEKKPGFFKRIFGSKKKEAEKPKPSLNEIDGILKNIENDLKNKEI